ncbi:alpha-L-rhamnosidase [Scatolibacter rhodanostii]|uniref:alpha-L-rhamnosidase n=1 Tax=Scatolibacter rhodanostii TaxID=2014781 RepID=UPI000C07F5EB|nr:alpha-L-rhamnosidase [Scatolibacter rhodanostii]
MLKICSLKANGLQQGCVTDTAPNISFALESNLAGEELQKAVITIGSWQSETTDQINNLYTGSLTPFTKYEVHVQAIGTSGESAEATTSFETGRLNTPWTGKWITDSTYDFSKKESPKPMTFRRQFSAGKPLKRAWIHATALGIYELLLDGKKVGEDYFSPGNTAYLHQIQYQTYNITACLGKEHTLIAVVGGGWAAGNFNHVRKSKISADKQAFLCEIHIEYQDGTSEIIATDENWQVSEEGNYQFAEFYDGETYDARINLDKINWKKAGITSPRGTPNLLAGYGAPVRVQAEMKPISCVTSPSGELIYDFGQNFAGVISAKLSGKNGQTVIFRHAEVLVDDELFVKSLRTAKATATYICTNGQQSYSPRMTYMGFRYVGIRGISAKDIELSGLVLHSDIEEIGTFKCSNELINKLQSNIRWGGKSNFVDIPTDCPQRDEREGWTGDIAVFANTACYNFDMSRFFDKWLLDMRAEQGKGGGIPMVIPRTGDSWPIHANSCWGDSCILVPWAEYMARGNKKMLADQYPTMKKFLKSAKWWAGFLSVRENNRHIWRFPFHWGDWCAPGGNFMQWTGKAKWVATAYFANSCRLVAHIADLLDKPEEATYYRDLRSKIIKAYREVFTDKNGKLKNEFQTAYVLPLYFGMTEGDETTAMADNLARLVKEGGNHLSTGFTGTPYLLFALSDYGHIDTAFDVLLQENCPSWLYEVKAGGTTIWERWDALRPDGTVNIGDLSGGSDEKSDGGMVSFNHYANGAVGDWLYRRIAGIEAKSGGYKTFSIAPLLGGGITAAKGSVQTPYGTVVSDWQLKDNLFTIHIAVPVSCECTLTLPNDTIHHLKSGTHTFSCEHNTN